MDRLNNVALILNPGFCCWWRCMVKWIKLIYEGVDGCSDLEEKDLKGICLDMKLYVPRQTDDQPYN
jgi:hypothetical protein